MEVDMQIEVEDIRRLAIKPGETLVVHLHDHASQADLDRISHAVKDHVPDGVEVMVTTSNVELSVLTTED